MIQDLIKTSKDKEELRECIKLLSESLFKANEFENTLKNKIPIKYVDFLKSLIKDRLDRTETENALDKLNGYLNRLKEINLVIAFDPTQGNIDNIYAWVKKNLGENIILNLKVDPDIIAGAIITYAGFYDDFSLKKSIETGFIEKRSDIGKLLK